MDKTPAIGGPSAGAHAPSNAAENPARISAPPPEKVSTGTSLTVGLAPTSAGAPQAPKMQGVIVPEDFAVGVAFQPTRESTAQRLAAIRSAWASMPGRLATYASEANGNRPVLVYLPPACDLHQPVNVITFFHGHGADIGDCLKERGFLTRVRRVTEPPGDPQTVYVFPEAADAPFTYWMQAPESFAQLVEEALARAAQIGGVDTLRIRARIVEAHSGGGLAIANAIAAKKLAADKINLLDATYGDWGNTAIEYALAEYRRGHRVLVESWYTEHAEMIDHNIAMENLARSQNLDALVATHDVDEETHWGVPVFHMGTP